MGRVTRVRPESCCPAELCEWMGATHGSSLHPGGRRRRRGRERCDGDWAMPRSPTSLGGTYGSDLVSDRMLCYLTSLRLSLWVTLPHLSDLCAVVPLVHIAGPPPCVVMLLLTTCSDRIGICPREESITIGLADSPLCCRRPSTPSTPSTEAGEADKLIAHTAPVESWIHGVTPQAVRTARRVDGRDRGV